MASEDRIDELLSAWNSAPVKPRLEELCGSCPELLEPLRQRVSLMEQADRLLETARLLSVDGRAAADRGFRAAPDPLPDPDYVGRYRIVGRIGEGGMGVVYRAEQREPVRRLVALKLIKLGMDSREVVARFEAERQALAMMNHPNVAKVLEAGVTETGRPYFAMELVQGIDLVRYCQDENLSVRQRLELFLPVCEAVQHAHQKGIIHRDLKPSNILVQLIDGRPVPKVIDFGIAKATNQVLTQQTLFTHAGAMIGTPEYMSPEQAMTSGLDVDTRTDIYSLGVILYQLLTGALPIDPSAVRKAGLEGMARLIRNSDPQRPSARLLALAETGGSSPASGLTRNTRLAHKELREDLDWIVLKAMEKERSRRYETAQVLAMDIRRHLDNEPVLARPPSRVYRAQKFASRYRTGVLAATGVLTALTAGLLVASIGFVRASGALRLARDEAKRADESARKAEESANKAEESRKELEESRKRADANAARASESEKREKENAKKADENARRAELMFANSLLARADVLCSAMRFSEADSVYAEAYKKFVELGRPLVSAEVGLWSSYHEASFPLLRFEGRTSEFVSVSVDREGRTALSGGLDGALKVLKISTGAVRAIHGHSQPVSGVAVSADGRWGVSGSYDRTIKIWDLATGTERRTIAGHTQPVRAVAITPDGATVLASGWDKTLRTWDASNGQELHNITLPSPVDQISVSADGQTAFWFNLDGMTLYDIPGGTTIGTWSVDKATAEVTCAALVPGKREVVCGTRDGSLKRLDLANRREIRTFGGNSSPVECVAVSPDGAVALSGGKDRVLRLWNLADGRELHKFVGHREGITRIEFVAGGRTAVSWAGSSVLVWDILCSNGLRVLGGRGGGVSGVAVSPDNRIGLTGIRGGKVMVWDVATGMALRVLEPKGYQGREVVIAPDGRRILLPCGKTVRIWDAYEGKEISAFTVHDNDATCVSIAPDGRTVISGGVDGALKLWDVETGKELRTFTGHADAVLCVAFFPDGRTVVSGGRDGTVRAWDVSGKAIGTFVGHAGPVTSVAISPDGGTLLSGSHDQTLKIWDLIAGREKLTFTGHTDRVTRVGIFPDGKTGWSVGDDKTVRLWDLTNGEELRTLGGLLGQAPDLVISADGLVALSGSGIGGVAAGEAGDFRAELWNLNYGGVRREFESRVAAAQRSLEVMPGEPQALGTLGQWYALCDMDERAVEVLELARRGGQRVPPLVLARCYWKLGQFAEARKEFRAALEQSGDPRERDYLSLCISAVAESAAARMGISGGNGG